jgi:hypothetical protein
MPTFKVFIIFDTSIIKFFIPKLFADSFDCIAYELYKYAIIHKIAHLSKNILSLCIVTQDIL